MTGQKEIFGGSRDFFLSLRPNSPFVGAWLSRRKRDFSGTATITGLSMPCHAKMLKALLRPSFRGHNGNNFSFAQPFIGIPDCAPGRGGRRRLLTNIVRKEGFRAAGLWWLWLRPENKQSGMRFSLPLGRLTLTFQPDAG